MKTRFAILMLVPCLAGSLQAEEPLPHAKPNAALILVDDMGYGDIAAHGNPILKTPHLDKLHAGSARLTVGEMRKMIAATKGATECSFDFKLAKDLPLPVKAELLDSSGKTLAGACYVYCRFTKP